MRLQIYFFLKQIQLDNFFYKKKPRRIAGASIKICDVVIVSPLSLQQFR